MIEFEWRLQYSDEWVVWSMLADTFRNAGRVESRGSRPAFLQFSATIAVEKGGFFTFLWMSFRRNLMTPVNIPRRTLQRLRNAGPPSLVGACAGACFFRHVCLSNSQPRAIRTERIWALINASAMAGIRRLSSQLTEARPSHCCFRSFGLSPLRACSRASAVRRKFSNLGSLETGKFSLLWRNV